jgi:hypothetical protein
MNSKQVMKQMVLLIGLICVGAGVAYADKDKYRDRNDRRDRYEHRDRHDYRSHRGYERPPKNYRLDRRYRHDRYYPRPGYSIKSLPHKHFSMRYHNHHYYYHGGIWYRPIGSRFVVIAPPIGIVVPFLPPFYTTIWYSGVPYYYANDVYYVWDATREGYVVSSPPPNVNEEQPPLVADELYVYPKKGQSEQQQADDRFACHEWGVKQSGFDPTRPPGEIGQAELNTKREDYQRAMRACLEGRGYSVR